MQNIFNPQPNPLAIKQLKDNWGWYLALGISLVIVGTLALMYSYTTTIFSVLYLGMIMILLGGLEVAQSFSLSKWGSLFLHLFLGILFVATGLFVINNPAMNALSLTLFLAVFFVVSGIAKIFFAIQHHVPHKNWLIFNGVITALLGILIWQQWPTSGLWVIGMMVGIDTIMSGWRCIMLALAAKDLKVNA